MIRKILRGAKWVGLALLVLLVAAIAVALVSEHRQHAAFSSIQGESVDPEEPRYTSAIIASAVDMVNASRNTVASWPKDNPLLQNTKQTYYRRDVHAKSHACLAAKFTVYDIDPRFRQGVFAQSRSYPAWIRFSNGDTMLKSDSDHDARGFAIKLMDVPGDKLLEPEKTARTQDFIMINSPTFFIQTIGEYADFTAALGRGDNYGYFFGNRSLDPRTWKLRQMWLGLRTLKSPPESLLTTRYYSLSAYDFGPSLHVKYGVRPCSDQKLAPVGNVASSDPNYLRKALQSQLQRRPGCMEFMVQPQVLGKDMPVEDTTVEWSETDSPFVPLARIDIAQAPRIDETEQTFCDNLSFNPWHALPAHRPIGVMNRIRKAVYQEVSRYRRCRNGVAFAEPEPDSFKTFQLRGEKCEIPTDSIATTVAAPVAPGASPSRGAW